MVGETGKRETISGGRLQEQFIGIAGLIGAGKSTLATKLAERLGLPAYYEPVQDNEYLADFYRSPSDYAFPMQIYLLNKRFQQHQEIIWRGRGGVQDRTIYEDSIFARVLMEQGLMDQRDYETYLELFRHMSHFMCKPNLIIFLDLSPETSLERIKLRDRSVESGIELSYLRALHNAYLSFIDDISRTLPVIRVDWERFRSTDEVVEKIESAYIEESFIREVSWRPTR